VPEEEPLEKLTDREEEILKLLAAGLSNKEIAQKLSLSEGTVKNHISAILAKLHANDRTQAVLTALKRGLVDLKEFVRLNVLAVLHPSQRLIGSVTPSRLNSSAPSPPSTQTSDKRDLTRQRSH
jgi:DNA-binding CsgD family transcriptional regulator